MVRKVSRIINTYNYDFRFGGFTDGLGLIPLDVVDDVVVASTGYDDEIISRINQAVGKPN